MTEICAELGLSERSLREWCNKHLGMGPSRYSRLRRMQQVQRILRRIDPRSTSITKIAGQYGIRDLGRFAASYRVLTANCCQHTAAA